MTFTHSRSFSLLFVFPPFSLMNNRLQHDEDLNLHPKNISFFIDIVRSPHHTMTAASRIIPCFQLVLSILLCIFFANLWIFCWEHDSFEY